MRGYLQSQNELLAMIISILNRLSNLYYRWKTAMYYRPQFAAIGARSSIRKPILITNPRYISIGKNSGIRDGARLEVVLSNPKRVPALSIGDDTNIEQNVHIVCHNRVTIGSHVSVTGGCSIVDVSHPYIDIHDQAKIGDRILDEDSFVEIGDGSFIGMGTVILPNVRIGKYVIVGANSVVTKSIPDYCVTAGVPARVLKRYRHEENRWILEP